MCTINKKLTVYEIDKINGWKICSKCQTKKDLNQFRFKAKNIRLKTICSSCESQNSAKWDNDNKEKRRKQKKEYELINKEILKEKRAARYIKNKEKHDKITREYYYRDKTYLITEGKAVEVKCNFCGSKIIREIKLLNKSKHFFCGYKCQGHYLNQNRIFEKGKSRSKLEKWIESNLNELYPSLEKIYNYKIPNNGCEIDIFFPSLLIGFEINGPVHYEPIYGEEKLKIVMNNDRRKMDYCISNNINLYIIDSSKQSIFKPETSTRFLEFIVTILDKLLNCST